MDFKNYEIFLASIEKDIQRIFEHQKEYIHCKKGCSYCCEKGDYPLSEIEFNYLQNGYNELDKNIQAKIDKNIENLKTENTDSYACPFLINSECSVYKYRPFVCRTFGVTMEDAEGNPTFPFCCEKGLNYYKIFDKEKNHLSLELVLKNNFMISPKFFRLSNRVIMNLPLAKELKINFGEAKPMKEFFINN